MGQMKSLSDQAGLPECPCCLNAMELVRQWPRIGGLPEMKSFKCRSCDVTFTEAVTGEAPLPQRANALHLEPCHVWH
jgi:transposase-like protein